MQQPHPPILIAGDGERTLQRVVSYGDEWLPLGRFLKPERLRSRMVELQELSAAAGRDAIPVSLFNVPTDDRAKQDAFAELGVRRIYFQVPTAGEEEVLHCLDTLAQLAERLA